MMWLIFLICTTFFLLNMLRSILGMKIGFFAEIHKDNDLSKDIKSSIVELDKTIESQLLKVKALYPRFNTEDFLQKSEKAFELVFDAYAKEDKETLKTLLTPDAYQVFASAIDDRKSKGEILTGSLIRFIKKEIIDVNITIEDIFITVSFLTEQANVLKTADGTIIDGENDYIEKRSEGWVFCRSKRSMDPKWFLYEIRDL